jgi:N-acetylglucosamine kinase-like BadF-type ATPase
MQYFLALDAGGTKTEYVLANDTHEIARTRTGTIKRLRTDAETAARNLDQALDELSANTGIPMQAVTRTCIGTAGESVALVSDWLREAFAQRVGGDLILLGDVEIALDAAFHGAPGVLALAGTGSNVAGRAVTGQLITAGGWGPVLADQGSGHRIGYCALRDLFLALDEERPTLLLNAICSFWNIPTIEGLVEFANATPLPDFSRLSTVVLDCARQGDSVAQKVLQREGEELAHLALIALRRLERIAGQPDLSPHIAFAGSIFEKVEPVRTALLDSLRSEYPNLQARAGVVDPITGALWRARRGY